MTRAPIHSYTARWRRIPVVLGRNVGQRPLAGELQRRHAGGLIALNVGVHGHGRQGNLPGGMEALRTADEIRDVNTRYHDVAAAELRLQVGHRLRRHRPDARCSASCASCSAPSSTTATTARWRSAPAPATSASTCSRPASSREATCTDISPGMVATLGAQRRAARACRSGPPAPTPSRCRSPTRASTSCSATPSCTTCPTCAARSPSFTACCAPAGGSCSPASRRGSGDRIASLPKRGANAAGARVAAAAAGRAGAAARGARDRPTSVDHELERCVDIHAFAPGDLVAPRAPGRLPRRHGPRRGADGQLVRLVQPRARGERRPRRRADAVAPVRVPRLPAASSASTSALLEPLLPPAIFYNLLLTARRS